MQIVVHYPKSINAQNILSQYVAEIHAKSAMERLKQMQLSEEQLKEIFNMICDKIKKN